MNKYITLILIIIGNFVSSQVGIGTPTPHPSSDLDLGAVNKVLYLNRVSNTTVINDPQPGMLVFDTSEHCVKAYQDDPPKWSGCLDSVSGTVSGFTCSSASFSPATASQGASYTGTLTIPYTGGNGGTYTAQSFTQNGLTFTLTAGNFSIGTGNLVYNINGIPTASGTTSVNIMTGGQSCNGLTLTVNP
ncbi:putative hemagglutinin-related protein [Chryseobacterium sp. StRB126]|uniref:hypothetical protein n=1 Tax=Chryseobacterium sp. StRB126 TaxID=878220 RepID=UPI0004E999B9|nr:hypothetical protein [Chryseobacterium sp. StRB126]BAP32505.1 putative hemagglutinin-related protein [Chryseobacterium sp. StRB126]